MPANPGRAARLSRGRRLNENAPWREAERPAFFARNPSYHRAAPSGEIVSILFIIFKFIIATMLARASITRQAKSGTLNMPV